MSLWPHNLAMDGWLTLAGVLAWPFRNLKWRDAVAPFVAWAFAVVAMAWRAGWTPTGWFQAVMLSPLTMPIALIVGAIVFIGSHGVGIWLLEKLVRAPRQSSVLHQALAFLCSLFGLLFVLLLINLGSGGGFYRGA
jgi:hypothetical protein